MAVAVIGPAQRQDLALAASGQEKQTHGRDRKRTPPLMGAERCGQAPEFPVGEKALSALAAVAPDALAGIGVPRSQAHPFRFPHDDGQHRHGPVGRDRRRTKRGEPVPDVLPIDPGDLAPGEIRQNLVLQIGPVDGERSGFPDPLVAPEHNLRDPLEQRFPGIGGQPLAAPDRAKHFARADTRLTGGHRFGAANGLPDPLPAILAVDEELLPAVGRHPDAEAYELSVANLAHGLAGLQHPDARFGNGLPCHALFSRVRITAGKRQS